MNSAVDNTCYVALIDDDAHSARLLTRALLAHGSPRIEPLGGAAEAMFRLSGMQADAWPALLIVDLKSHSDANLDFLAALAPLIAPLGLPVVVMAQPLDHQACTALHEAGAAAVFTRHADRDSYRREAGNIISFWARSQRLDAVGM